MPATPALLRRSVSALMDVAFPPTCAACGTSIATADDFCPACFADLELFDSIVCQRCSTPIMGEAIDGAADCPICRDERWAFDRVLALGPYEGLLRRLVLDTKRVSGEQAAVVLGKMIAVHHIESLRVADWVVPIPQHWTRRLARRADGVVAMSRALANWSGVPLERLLSRCRSTPKQTSVAPSDRAKNVRGAFRVGMPKRVAGRTIVLVDDVFTTGATCHAAAQALKKAGAEQVVTVVAARRIGSW